MNNELKNLNDWRILNSIQYKWDTAAQQAIIQALQPKQPNRIDMILANMDMHAAKVSHLLKDH